MKNYFKQMAAVFYLSIFFTCTAFAGDDMAGHDMTNKDKIGDLIHESVVDGYMLSYYFMDLRDQKTSDKEKEAMDKPHHLMVYIMDKSHKAVVKAKVGFLIKSDDGNTQKAMGMFMSDGFGITADMKKKGAYKIATKAKLGDIKLMDSFNYEMK